MSKTIRERFEEKFIPEPMSGCWLWTASVINEGYGRFEIGYKTVSAHRVSFALYKGEIPNGMHVLHSCDVKSCVNPEHLRVGTSQQNTKEAFDRGLRPSMVGENNPRAKLCFSDVIKIRGLRQSGWGVGRLVSEFGISRSQVKRIINNKVWRK